MEIRQIIEQAIPLTMDCAVKRSEEISRRAQLRVSIEELIRYEIKSHESINNNRLSTGADGLPLML